MVYCLKFIIFLLDFISDLTFHFISSPSRPPGLALLHTKIHFLELISKFYRNFLPVRAILSNSENWNLIILFSREMRGTNEG